MYWQGEVELALPFLPPSPHILSMNLLLLMLLVALSLLPAIPAIIAAWLESRYRRGGRVLWLMPSVLFLLTCAFVPVWLFGLIWIHEEHEAFDWVNQYVVVTPGALSYYSLYRAIYHQFFVFHAKCGQNPDAAHVRRAARSSMVYLMALFVLHWLTSSALKSMVWFQEHPTHVWPVTVIGLISISAFLAPAIISVFNRWKPLPQGPLQEQTLSLAKRAGVLPPRVRVLESDLPNAWVTGLIGQRSTVFLTKGLLSDLPERQVLAVIAHELGHVRLGHVSIYLSLSLLSIYSGWLSAELLPASLAGHAGLMRTSVFVGLAPVLTSIVIRRCELAADRFSAELTGDPLALAEALVAITKAVDQVRSKQGPVRSFLTRLVSTHPATEERARRLVEMNAERGADASNSLS